MQSQQEEDTECRAWGVGGGQSEGGDQLISRSSPCFLERRAPVCQVLEGITGATRVREAVTEMSAHLEPATLLINVPGTAITACPGHSRKSQGAVPFKKGRAQTNRGIQRTCETMC